MSRNPQRISGVLYPIELPVRYQAVGSKQLSGSAHTLVISSGTLRLSCDRALSAHLKIRISIAWPASLPDGTRLNLWIQGEVVRSVLKEVTVKVNRYEFRTRRPVQSSNGAIGGTLPQSALGRTAGAGA